MFDKTFGLPIPPLDMVATTATSNAWALTFVATAILAGLYGLKHWRDTGRPILLLVILGGGLASLCEPLIDLIGGVWYPIHGQPIAFEFMGHYIPWWCVAVYSAYFGAQGGLIYWLLHRGIVQKNLTMKTLRLAILIPTVVDVLLEEVLLTSDIYTYYGQQPLVLIKSFPIWYGAVNSLGCFISIVLVCVCAPYLKGFKLLAVPFLIPLGQLFGYVSAGLPSFYAVNTAGLRNWAVQACGIVTCLLVVLVFHVIELAIATDSPLRRQPHPVFV